MILVLNCGSQSVKWKVFDLKLKLIKENKLEISDADKYKETLEEEIKKIVMSDITITLIGHRVVHGGGKFIEPVKIDNSVLEELEKISSLAPLHNPYNILGIKACQEIFSSARQIAFFDTEFFSNLPEKAFTYALSENITKAFNFRRFGFHGTSHEYAARKAAEKVRKPFAKLRIITCHLGGGASITAIKNGKATDTSMGFTPMEGLVMMTRTGNVDSGIILELCEKLGVEKTKEILNKESGLKGICGEGDMLRILEKIRNPEAADRRRAELALDIFVYSIQKYIGAYFAILGGCDVLVFTGAIGAGSAKIRSMILKDLKVLKIKKVLAIEANEELAIAQKIKNF